MVPELCVGGWMWSAKLLGNKNPILSNVLKSCVLFQVHYAFVEGVSKQKSDTSQYVG